MSMKPAFAHGVSVFNIKIFLRSIHSSKFFQRKHTIGVEGGLGSYSKKAEENS